MASITLNNVSLNYTIYGTKSRSLRSQIYASVAGKVLSDKDYVEVQALSNLSFKINNGDRVAIIGDNGAGKTTLLKVLAGIYEPPFGSMEIEGKVSSITEVTMGMDLEATGRENIIMRCIFLGMTYKEIKTKLPEIEKFTELGSYLNLPARTYSSGMLLRLGFAASTACSPNILIMDEMIGAGDSAFAEKAQLRIKKFISGVNILILASHNTSILRQFCNKAIFLESGRIRMQGALDDVLNAYDKSTAVN